MQGPAATNPRDRRQKYSRILSNRDLLGMCCLNVKHEENSLSSEFFLQDFADTFEDDLYNSGDRELIFDGDTYEPEFSISALCCINFAS